MNYYERIQKSINYMEDNLENVIDVNRAASEAFMSSSSYYRLFFALTGHTAKEYIRRRRISTAVRCIREGNRSILDLALTYGFESNESFTRACRREAGYPPSAFRKKILDFQFERINIMDKFYDEQDKELLEKYPDIVVLKKLPPIRVAYYCFFGKEPEFGAFSVMADWLKRSGRHFDRDGMRIFGFNNPSPTEPEQTEYGYEVWVTIPNGLEVTDSRVGTKTFPGGQYAVCSVPGPEAGVMGAGIAETWQRFIQWLTESKYESGDHQWLEEHLHFNDAFEHTGGVDLYMPIQKKQLSCVENQMVREQ